MTFRSLYRLERRGLLQCPILGVAADDWTDDDLRAHARAAIEACGETIDEATFARFAARLSYLGGDFADARDVRARRAARSMARSARLLPRDPAGAVRDGRQRPGGRGPDRARARRGREAVRPRSRVGARAAGRARGPPARGAALPDRPLPREDGAGRDPLPAVRERDLRADLEPQLRRVRADHDGRGLRRRRPRALLRPGRRAARRRRQPPHAGGRRRRDGAAGGHGPAHAQGLDRRRPARHPRRRSRPLRARPARGLPRDRRASRRTRRPRPTPRCAWTSTTGAGPACRSSSAPASACPRPRPRRVSCSGGRRGWVSSPRARGGPSPTRSSSSSTRRPGSAWSSTPSAATAASPSGSRWTWSSPTRAARAPRPTRSCSDAAMRGDSMRFTRQDARRGAVADHAAAARRAAAGAPVREGHVGPGGRRPACRTASAAGTARGWRHDRRRRRPRRPRGRAAERGRAVAVPADRVLRLPLELPHRGAGRARRRDRLAVRAVVRLAERVRDAAGPPGRLLPRRAVRHRRPGRAGVRAGHQHARDDLAHAERLGRRARRADDGPAHAARTR